MKHFMIMLAVLTASVASGLGADYRGNENVRVEAGDSLFADLISGSRYVDIMGYVDGDVYSGCERMNVEGEIKDDFFAGAREITVKGKVGGMVVGAGQSVTIDGEVGSDVIAFGAEVRITPRAHIKGNLFVGSGSLMFDGGRVDGWIKGGVGQLYLNGSVGEPVSLEAGDVRFGNDYYAPQGTRLTLPKDLDSHMPNLPNNLEIEIKNRKAFYQSGFFYWSLVSMFVVGLLISLIFKNFTHNLLDVARRNIFKNTGIGFLFLIAAPIAIIILIALILTIPAALILLALYFILLYLSSILTGLYAGKYIFELLGKKSEQPNLVLSLIVGLILVVLFPKLPFIGWLIKLAVISFGMGSFVVYLWGFRQKI